MELPQVRSDGTWRHRDRGRIRSENDGNPGGLQKGLILMGRLRDAQGGAQATPAGAVRTIQNRPRTDASAYERPV